MAYDERIDPDDPGFSEIERHIHKGRYEFATALDLGPLVLDCACGIGYGSRILARNPSRRVVGVDISAHAIAAASEGANPPNLEFLRADATDAKSLPGPFSAVVSFETIEHVPNPDEILAGFRAALRPGGLLLISTPNGGITSPLRRLKPANRFHVWEENVARFVERLRRAGFVVRESYGQGGIGGVMLPLYRLARMRGQIMARGPLRLVEERILMLESRAVRMLQSSVVAGPEDALPSKRVPVENCVYQVHICRKTDG